MPRRQFSSSIAPSFVEAVAGQQNPTPDATHVALAEELLVRLELDDVAVRLNLLGQPGEHPDFVVASWVLPYVYALRGDRDWRRSPQLTGSRQVSQLAVQAYKLLEAGDTTIADLKHTLGREVTETAVLRAITELWQQLRIIPVIAAPGVSAKWQLLRHRFQKAIAEGASTSQVTAISVLASIYLQAVIAASMEEVEMFLAPLTARSKVREVLRGLVATRQVHTISLGHSPHFYVAGTLPEFAVAPSMYASSSMPASAYFLRSQEAEEDLAEIHSSKPFPVQPLVEEPKPVAEAHIVRPSIVRKPVSNSKPIAARPHFSRPATQTRDRKPAQSSSASRPARRPPSDSRSTAARPSGAHGSNGARPSAGTRWKSNPPAGAKAGQNGNGSHAGNGNGKGPHAAGTHATGTHAVGNGARTNGSASRPSGSRPSNSRPASGKADARTTKSSTPAWGQRNGSANGSKSASKPASNARNGSSRNGNAPRKDARADARPSRNGVSRKPALAAGAKAGNSKRYGFTSRPSPTRPSSTKASSAKSSSNRSSKETKKRG